MEFKNRVKIETLLILGKKRLNVADFESVEDWRGKK
jgi:hypothetical protein